MKVISYFSWTIVFSLCFHLGRLSAIDNALPSRTDSENGDIFRESYTSRMVSYMNTSIDPCNDFYEYACGNWKSVKSDRNVKGKRSNLLDIYYNIYKQIEQILNKSPEDVPNYHKEFKAAKKYYKSCLDAELYPPRRIEEYLQILEDIGGFPALNSSWNASNFDWYYMSSHLGQYGVENFFNEHILPQYPFPPYFKMPEFGFDVNINAQNMANKSGDGFTLNTQTMSQLLQLYGVNESHAAEIIDGIFDFWLELVQSKKALDEFGSCEDIMLDSDMNSMNWTQGEDLNFVRYFQIAWGRNILKSENDTVESLCPSFYRMLPEIMKRAKPEAVANYLSLKFLNHMHGDFEKARYKSEYCVRNVKSGMSFLISELYVAEYLDDNAIVEVADILADVRTEIRKLFAVAEWIDEATKLEALEKEAKLISRIGRVRDPIVKDLIHEIDRLNLTDNFYENFLKMEKFRAFMHRYGHLEGVANDTMPVDILDATHVNAFYYVIDNSINILSGILYPPTYHRHFLKSLTYSGLGYTFGHELTHGFDPIGHNFDGDGVLRNWWSPKSQAEFERRMSCFDDQYDEFFVPEIGMNIDGKNTQDENIADSGGLRIAFSAYLTVLRDMNVGIGYGNEETLPGLNLTNTQTFFLHFAQFNCATYTKQVYWDEITDDHTSNKYRVLGTLRNYDQFSKHFNCSIGSNMNPANKCRVW